MRTLVCEICTQSIAQFDPDTVTRPLNGLMFLSVNPERKIPPPFHPSLGVFDFRCPWCRKMPFIGNFNKSSDVDAKIFPETLLTTDGVFVIGSPVATADSSPDGAPPVSSFPPKESQLLKCPKCGKEYQANDKGRVWFEKHLEKCNG